MDNNINVCNKLRVKSSWKINLRKVSFFLIAVLTVIFAKAQDTTAKKEIVDMATGMRSSGKIYVVVAVLCIILAGLFFYLINLDRKISKLEQ